MHACLQIRPLEEAYKFGHFFSPLLAEGDFEAKPSVMLLGQYSTGKSTFIKFLLGREYPGIHISPEPTTDRFVVVMHGPEERRTPGNTLVVQPDKPYTGLAQFGNGFLSKFEAASIDNRLLEEITLVDTPGVLSGEKQRIERTYDFIQVCGWFASRCDLILLLFDPHKLDISDEFKAVSIGGRRGPGCRGSWTPIHAFLRGRDGPVGCGARERRPGVWEGPWRGRGRLGKSPCAGRRAAEKAAAAATARLGNHSPWLLLLARPIPRHPPDSPR